MIGIPGWLVRAARLARGVWRRRGRSMEAIFTEIYRKNAWGHPESVSGRGSILARTVVIRRELPGLLAGVGARSLLDAPCGDFNWMRYVELGGVEYVGGDVVPELIERNRAAYEGEGRRFVTLDIVRDELPRADVVLCRDCFIHLSFRDARAAIANFKRSGSGFLLATTQPNVAKNQDIESGSWRAVNLQLPPFSLPEPLRLVVEDAEVGKCLGMWRLAEL
jgi:SAM-dependent methyltransferase